MRLSCDDFVSWASLNYTLGSGWPKRGAKHNHESAIEFG